MKRGIILVAACCWMLLAGWAAAQYVPMMVHTGNTDQTYPLGAKLFGGSVPSNTTGQMAYLFHDGRTVSAPSNATWKTIPLSFAPGAWTHQYVFTPVANVVSSNNAAGIYWVTNPPIGAVIMKMQCWGGGGAGGNGAGSVGGSGGYAEYLRNVTSNGEVIAVWAAQGGNELAAAGPSIPAYPGGGMGRASAVATYGAGGGGAFSAVAVNGTLMCVGGGGGGGGATTAGGAAGYPAGNNGNGNYGFGGSQSAGGAAGGTNSLPGTALQGGNVLSGYTTTGHGGGGGGYYGGGAGGGASTQHGGGGGGSSYVADINYGIAYPAGVINSTDPNYASGKSAAGTQAANGGSGMVVLSFYVP